MNIYKKLVDTLIETKTLTKHVKDLETIKVESVDDNLIIGIKNAIQEVAKIHSRSKLKSGLVSFDNINLSSQSEILKLLNFCKQQISVSKPEWQIVAERNGWKPPRT